MMVAKEPCGRWEFFWWICYHLFSVLLKTHAILFLNHLMCQRVSHQVILFFVLCDYFIDPTNHGHINRIS